MKKYIYTIIFISFTFTSAFSQSFKLDEGAVSSFNDVPAYLIDTVVNTSLTKEQLFSNALNFISNTYKDSRYIIETKEATLGEVVFKSSATTTFSYNETNKKGKISQINSGTTLYFKANIYVKDNKYKIVLSNLRRSISSALPDEVSALSLRIDDLKGDTYRSNGPALRLAINIVNDIASFMSKKPQSEF